MALLEATGLVKHFGSRGSVGCLAAVDGLSLTIERGEAYGLVGPDGAGKTTAMRLMVGALSLEKGQVRILGHDLPGSAEKARSAIGYLPQRFSLYGDLTVYENLFFFGSVRGIDRKILPGRARELLGFVGLAGFEGRLASQLSGGMKQKLGLACALIHRPPLLLLDEPTGGVDPLTRQDFWQLIIRLLAEGAGVLVSTPYMDEAVRCSRLGFMMAGRLLTTGSPRELVAPLAGRILELKAQPKDLANRVCRADPDVEDVATFGELLHLRLRGESSREDAKTRKEESEESAVNHKGTEHPKNSRNGGGSEADGVIERLLHALDAAGVRVHGLRPIAPSLEDVFISTLQGVARG